MEPNDSGEAHRDPSSMMTESSVSHMLTVAREAAIEAGEVLLDNLRSDFKVSKKGPINLVTEMDLKAQRIIVERIRRDFPNHQILAEEEGGSEGDSIFKWIIDPLDGTTNYAHGYRFFCTSIGMEANGKMILGVVYDPVTKELFTAERGKGSFLNDQAIRVSQEGVLIDSLLSTGFSYGQEEIKQNVNLFNRLIMKVRGIRRDGSAALDLCYVACGRFEGFWELNLNPWDVAAGKLVVEEAGGFVSCFDGSPCTIYDREIVATNGHVHGALLQLLKQS